MTLLGIRKNNTTISRLFAGCLIASSLFAPGLGTTAARAADNSTFGVIIENDVFFEADHDYTNGLQFSWVTSAGIETVGGVASFLTPHLPLSCRESGPTCHVRASYTLGQNMYTPRDIALPNPPLNDRPYAGWLYGSAGFAASAKLRDDLTVIDRIQLQIGIVGPSALGEQVQTYVHRVIGATKPLGWSYQIKDEAGVVLTHERSWRYNIDETLPLGLQLNVTPHVGFALGNVSTYMNGGGTVALGWNLGAFSGPPRIEPSTPGSSYFEPTGGDVSFYLFASADGRIVGRNIFLDGNTWTESRHVEKEILVIDSQIGWAVAVDTVRIAFSHVFRTREFKSQSDPDEYGSVNVTFAF